MPPKQAPKSAAPAKTPAKSPAPAKTPAKSTVAPPTSSVMSQKSVGPTTPAMMPTPDMVNASAGSAVTEEELAKMQASGSLPAGVNVAMKPTMHKIKQGDEELVVIMLDAPPCGCRKVNNKRDRCRIHRKEKRDKKKNKKKSTKKDNMARDDDSDRKKLGALRHAEDSDEEVEKAIEGALTPDFIAKYTVLGVAVLIPIDRAGNGDLVGPRAAPPMDRVKGILIKGPQDCPQFIPEDKLKDGKAKYPKCTEGSLVKNEKGKFVFYSDKDCQPDAKGNPVNLVADGVDAKDQEKVGAANHQAGIVDVNESGMPEFRPVDETHPAPQDKFATVGVLAKIDNEVVFVQTKGQTVGSGDNAPVIATTREGAVAAGTVLGEAVITKDGKLEVVPVGKVPDGATVIGKVVQGDYNQPVLIANKDTTIDKANCVNVVPAEAAKYQDKEWQELAKKEETNQATFAAETKNAEVAAQAKISGKSTDQVKKDMEASANPANGAAAACEVQSVAFNSGPFDPNASVFVTPGNIAKARAAETKRDSNVSVFATGASGANSGGGCQSVFMSK